MTDPHESDGSTEQQPRETSIPVDLDTFCQDHFGKPPEEVICKVNNYLLLDGQNVPDDCYLSSAPRLECGKCGSQHIVAATGETSLERKNERFRVKWGLRSAFAAWILLCLAVGSGLDGRAASFVIFSLCAVIAFYASHRLM